MFRNNDPRTRPPRLRRCPAPINLAGASMVGMAILLEIAPISVTRAADAVYTPNQQNSANGTAGQMSTPLTLLWKRAASGVSQDSQSPIYADGTLYYAAGKNVCAVHASDGTTMWTCTGSAAFDASPAISGDALYISSDNACLYKISLKDGSIVWKRDMVTQMRSSPVFANGHVYVGTEDGHVDAIDPATGRITWSFEAGDAVSMPVAVDDTGTVIFCAGGSKLYGVNSENGRREWQLHFTDSIDVPLTCAGDTVYVGAGQILYELRSRDGSIQRQVKLGRSIASSPAVQAGNAFVATDDSKIASINDRGFQVWLTALSSRSKTPPVLAGKTVFVSTEHGILLAYSADTGALQWEYALQSPGKIEAASVYADNALYVLGTDGSLTAFQAQAKDQASPEITGMVPKDGSIISGINASYAAKIVDEGSGISPSAVNLTLDGTVLDAARYSAEQNGISVSPGTVQLPPLSDGPHTMVVKAADWKGNTAVKTWHFSVDSSGKTVTGPYTANPTASSTEQANSPYPAPTSDPAERIRERQQAAQIFRELMRQYQENGRNGPPPPRPPSY